MRASDIMIKDVITVQPEAKVSHIADLFVRHRISCVPVVTSENDLVGLVTASDLIHRKETDTERRRKWWLDMFVDADTRAREFVKAHGMTAKDVMTPTVISISETAALADVAETLEAHRIRRVPVVRGGKLVGLVSRADLVRALATTARSDSGTRLDNRELYAAIDQAVKANGWLNTIYINYTVENGDVEVRGFADSDVQRQALRVLIEEVPGVRSVHDHLVVRRWPTAA